VAAIVPGHLNYVRACRTGTRVALPVLWTGRTDRRRSWGRPVPYHGLAYLLRDPGRPARRRL